MKFDYALPMFTKYFVHLNPRNRKHNRKYWVNHDKNHDTVKREPHLCNIVLKGIVSRDIGGLQMISMDRIVVPDVPLEVYSFLNFRFHIDF